jgi:aromatic ring-cleaving dioxygenase
MRVSLNSGLIPFYHAHIYYDADTRHLASALRDAFIELTKVEFSSDDYAFGKTFADLVNVGRMHDGPVGPHTKPMFRIELHSSVFKLIVNHLMLNHGDLSVLIHPETSDPFKDHTLCTLWLGSKVPIDLTKL